MTQLYIPSSVGCFRPQGLSVDYAVEGRTIARSRPRLMSHAIDHAPGPSVQLENRKEHILVVDDDPTLREVLATVLRGGGYKVDCAVDGEDAWRALREQSFGLLITDHDMPRLTGIELLRRLRSSLGCIPGILVSGKMPWGEPDFESLLTPGLALEKPYSLTQLLAEVRHLVSCGVRGA